MTAQQNNDQLENECAAHALPPVRMGVDIGGTKVAIVALDVRTGQTLKTDRLLTPNSYEQMMRHLVDLVTTYEKELGTLTFGMCYPGTSDHNGQIKNSNIWWLNNQTFESDLSSAIRRPIRTDNDANCFTLSEAIDGAATEGDVVFGVTLGTGLGGGLVLNKNIHKGRHGLAGEWGHNPLPWPSARERPGPQCSCGLRGCLETFLCGAGLSRSYLHDTGQILSPEAVVEMAASGDDSANSALLRYENRLARALATVINFLDPDVIVIGGGLSRIDRLYPGVLRQWGKYILSTQAVSTQLVRAKHGGESGMKGAAYLWGHEF